MTPRCLLIALLLVACGEPAPVQPPPQPAVILFADGDCTWVATRRRHLELKLIGCDLPRIEI